MLFSLTKSPLFQISGSGGKQKIFFNRGAGILTTLIYFGDGVEGWPEVVHGGILSTLFKEAMERLASEVFPPGTSSEPSKMNISFQQKVQPGDLYQLSALPAGRFVLYSEDMPDGPFNLDPAERRNAVFAYLTRANGGDGPLASNQVTLALGHGIFKVPQPFQMDEQGNIT